MENNYTLSHFFFFCNHNNDLRKKQNRLKVKSLPFFFLYKTSLITRFTIEIQKICKTIELDFWTELKPVKKDIKKSHYSPIIKPNNIFLNNNSIDNITIIEHLIWWSWIFMIYTLFCFYNLYFVNSIWSKKYNSQEKEI